MSMTLVRLLAGCAMISTAAALFAAPQTQACRDFLSRVLRY